jgi:hypothetical protein
MAANVRHPARQPVQQLPQVDQNALKTGQALTILLLISAFIFNLPVIVAFVAVAQFTGALRLPFAPYALFYKYVVLALGIVQRNPQPDHFEPHAFALLVGTVFNATATLLMLLNAPVFGWLLVAVVVVLANLNFWLNFCAGCWMYYQLNQLGVAGFTQSPLKSGNPRQRRIR